MNKIKRTLRNYLIFLGMLVTFLSFGIFLQAALGGARGIETLIDFVKDLYWYIIAFFLISSAFLYWVFTAADKSTIKNCPLIKRFAISGLVGEPQINPNGKCGGYGDYNEPCKECRKCKAFNKYNTSTLVNINEKV